MYSMVTVVNNTHTAYLKVEKRYYKISSQGKKNCSNVWWGKKL